MLKSLLIIFLLLGAPHMYAQNKPSGQETLVVKTPNNCDHCKICETCGQKLETDLYYVRGIKSVEYDHATQTTKIVYKTKLVTPEKIRQEIAKLGFDADDLKANPDEYAKRDACCK